MSKTIETNSTLVTINCGECGGVYALNSRYVERKREIGGFWTCPYCKCSWGYPPNGSELAKLKRKLEQSEAREDESNFK